MVKELNRSSYICGNYNSDLLKIIRNRHFNDCFDNLITVGFFPKITRPTRFAEQSSTLIDKVFSSNTEERETSGILLNPTALKVAFKQYREALRSSITNHKVYYDRTFLLYQNNVRKTWAVIK